MTPRGWVVVEHYLDQIGDWVTLEVEGVSLSATMRRPGTGEYVVMPDTADPWTHVITAMPAPDSNGVVWRVPDLEGRTAAGFPRSIEDALALVARLHAPSPLAVDLSALAARAGELARAIRAARDGAAERERSLLYPLDEIAARAAEVKLELGKVAAGLDRYARRPARGCPADWGVCPEHGATIEMDPTSRYPDRMWRCWNRDCPRVWNYDRAAQPCTEQAAYSVTDPEKKVIEMCAGHVVAIRKLENAYEWHCTPLPAGS